MAFVACRTLLRVEFLWLQSTGTPSVKGPERHIEWMPRPIRRQYENAALSDFWKRLGSFGERILALMAALSWPTRAITASGTPASLSQEKKPRCMQFACAFWCKKRLFCAISYETDPLISLLCLEFNML
jgi:hypothetical protein